MAHPAFKRGRTEEGLKSVGQVIVNSNESIYYDTNITVSIANDSGVTPEGVHGRYARFQDTRNQNLIPDTGFYTVSLVRGHITSDCFPLFVPLLRPSTAGNPNPVFENGSYIWETTMEPGLALTWTGPVYTEGLASVVAPNVLPAVDSSLASWPTYGFISVFTNTGVTGLIDLGAVSSNPDVLATTAATRLTNAFSGIGLALTVAISATNSQYFTFSNSNAYTINLDFVFPSGYARFNNGAAAVPTNAGLLQACKFLGFIPGQTFTVPVGGAITSAPRPFQMGFRTTLDLYSYKNVRWTPEDTSAPPPGNTNTIATFEGTYFDCYTYQHLLNECVNPTFQRLIFDEWETVVTPGVTSIPLSELSLQRQLTYLCASNCNATTFWNAGASYNVGNSVIFDGRAYACQRAVVANQQTFNLEPTTNGVLNPDWVDAGPAILSTWSPNRSYNVGDVVSYAFAGNGRPTLYIAAANSGPSPSPEFPSFAVQPFTRITNFAWMGVQGSSTAPYAQPRWTFDFSGGAGAPAAASAYTTRTYKMFIGRSPLTALVDSGTLAFDATSYTWTGQTYNNVLASFEITATNNMGTEVTRSWFMNTAGRGFDCRAYVNSFSFAGGIGGTSASPTWTYNIDSATAPTTTVVRRLYGDSNPNPTTLLYSDTIPPPFVTSFVYSAPTVPNFYYKFEMIVDTGGFFSDDTLYGHVEISSTRRNNPAVNVFPNSTAVLMTNSPTLAINPNIAAIGTIPPKITFDSSTQLFVLNLDSYGFGGTSSTNAYDGYGGHAEDSESPPSISQQILNSSLNDKARDSWGLTGTNISTPAYSTFRRPGFVYDERMVVESDDYFNQLFGNWPLLRLNYIDPKTSLVTSYVRYDPQASNAGLTVPTPLPLVNPTVANTGYLPITRVAGNQPYLYTYPQDYPSIGLAWNPIDTIVITTNRVPCVPDQTVPPKVLGDINFGETISAGSKNIIAEFVVKDGNVRAGQEYRSQIVFEPNFENRIDLLRGTASFNSFDFEVFMRMKATQLLRRVTLGNGNALNIRWHFQLKSMG